MCDIAHTPYSTAPVFFLKIRKQSEQKYYTGTQFSRSALPEASDFPPSGLSQIDTAVLPVAGENPIPSLQTLLHRNLPRMVVVLALPKATPEITTSKARTQG
jgi:hypothetical protein